jgi:hypothetical protein
MLVVFGGPAESGRAALAQAVAEEAAAALLRVADATAATVALGLRSISGTVVVDIGLAPSDVRAAWGELAVRSSVPLLLVSVTRPPGGEPWAESHLAIDNVGPQRRQVKRVLNAMSALVALTVPPSYDPDEGPGRTTSASP